MNWDKIIYMSEVSRCLLCEDPACTEACPQNLEVGDIIRSLYFLNTKGAVEKLHTFKCKDCMAPCEDACVLGEHFTGINIRNIMEGVNFYSEKDVNHNKKKRDISANICSVKLENPFLLSSSVVASNYEMCAKAFSMGWAGCAFKTISTFEQHEASPRFATVDGPNNAFFGFKNIEQLSDHSVEENLEIFKRLKKDFPNKVIVASIMGKNEEEWETLARKCTEAGADVIECNFSCPNMENEDLGITIGQSEKLVEKYTRAARRGTEAPLLAKLTPNITDMVPIALAAKRGGADGLAAINTINSITSVDLKNFVAEPDVHGQSMVGGYSGAAVKPIALRFVSDLSNSPELNGMHISGMGGIENWKDALDYILLGAGSLQITTAVMQYGYRIIEDLISGLEYYLDGMNISSLSVIVGAAKETIVSHSDIERDTILLPRIKYEACVKCGRCYVSCYDGGHQAIEFGADRKPVIDVKKCVGCHLCRLVCPSGAIQTADKRIKKQ